MKSTAIVPEKNVTPVRYDPEFDRLRELHATGCRCVQEIATELERVRSVYLRNKNDNLQKGSAPKSHDETSGEDGFKAKVAEQLGISPATAYRYLSFAKALAICTQVESAPDGETIELEQGSYPVTPAVRAKAKKLREDLEGGIIPISRSLPAVAGAFQVPNGGTGGKAATNHPANIHAGLQKLITSLNAANWRQGPGKFKKGQGSWDDLVNEWCEVLGQVPEEIRSATLVWAEKSRRR